MDVIQALRTRGPLLARISSALVMLAGLVVLFGWWAGYDALTRVIPGAVTMKITTAIGFLFAGVAYSLMALRRHGPWIDGVASSSILCLGAIMLSHLWSSVSGNPFAFAHEETNAVQSVAPGVPSVCTMVLFLVTAMGGLAWMATRYRVTEWAGRLLILAGSTAIVGYVAGFAPLYCYFDGSSAMAVHTAGLFVLLGLSIAFRATARPGKPPVPPGWPEDQ